VQLRQTGDLVALLLRGSISYTDSDTTAAYPGLAAVVARETGGKLQPLPSLAKSKNWERFVVAKDSIGAFVRLHLGCKGPLQTQAAYMWAFGVIIQRLRDLAIPVTLKNILTRGPDIAGLVDAQFPGYASNGQLIRVLKPALERYV